MCCNLSTICGSTPVHRHPRVRAVRAEAKVATSDAGLDKVTSQIADLQSSEECSSSIQKMCRGGGLGGVSSSAPSALDEGACLCGGVLEG